MKTRTLAVLGAAMSACALTASPAMAATITVDDDRRDCRKAEFQTINAAVAAAAPGDTINVCRGVYPEYVQVGKPLTLLGARNGNAAAPGRQGDTSKESVVVNGGQGGFDVQSSDVEISGFTVQGNPASPSYPNAGIYLRTGSNRTIERNVLRDNGLGAYLEGAQQNLDVEKNAFIDNRRSLPGGQPSGGIFAAGGQVNDAHLDDNLFEGNQQFSINIGDGSSGGLTVNRNTGTGEGSFLVIGRTSDAQVAYNRLEDIRGSGVFSFGDNDRLVIEHNSINVGGGSGVRFTMSFGAGDAADPIIRHNRFHQHAFDGISLNGVTGALVEHNDVDDNANSGVRLQNADNGTIARNHADGNGKDGVNAEAQSTGNVIERNLLTDNAEHDCHDDSAGAFPGLVANEWLNNKGQTENRPGLCVADRP